MNFSWKVFFSTIIIMLITFSVGGYFLISALFKSTYEREIESAQEENKMLQYSLATALSAVSGSDHMMDKDLSDIADSMAGNIQGNSTQFCIRNQDYAMLYESKKMGAATQLLAQITPDTRGYVVLQNQEGYFIQTASMFTVSGQIFYLESFREISSIYQDREDQYQIYMRLLLALIGINGVITYLLSLWLTYPIKKVSRVAHKISGGNLDHRVKIKSQDEIGRLAQDFNRMTDSLENKIHELQEISRRQEDFIGSFAHELKTPLTSIIGYADILRSQKLSPEMAVMSADYIFKEGNRLEALSLKLLELIVMRKLELELKTVNVKQLLKEVEGLIFPVLVKENILLEISAESAAISVEPDLIKTVLINLIDNAKKAMDGKGRIIVSGKKEKGGYGIYIMDNGKGIPREELKRITEAFYMVDKSRAREKGGAGLGLAICDEIMKRHHGRMEFESVEGKGTMVHLSFQDGEV